MPRRVTVTDYQAYLASPEWEARRAKWLAGDYIRRCAACRRLHAKPMQFNLHHRHYRNLGRERMHDLVLLCRPCHRDLHSEQRRSAVPLELATDLFIASRNPNWDDIVRTPRRRRIVQKALTVSIAWVTAR